LAQIKPRVQGPSLGEKRNIRTSKVVLILLVSQAHLIGINFIDEHEGRDFQSWFNENQRKRSEANNKVFQIILIRDNRAKIRDILCSFNENQD
jgi:hypothetical protein